MTALFTNIFDNPILTRELRRRMRGRALIISIIAYISLMMMATLIVLMASAPKMEARVSSSMLEQLTSTGATLFQAISILQFILVLVIAPTITAGMTTGEKERKTFDFLRVTTITPWMYVTGCFLSTVFYVALALICAFPLLSLTFVYGGVTTGRVFSAFGLLLGGSLILSSFGLYVSSIRERTRTAQGIIVFTIFALLLLGGYFYNYFEQKFGAGATSATVAGAPAAGGTGGFFIGNVAIPQGLLVAAGIVLMTTMFLLLATRKLFEPESTRAFSHWQFLVLALCLLAPQVAFASGQQISELIALLFLSSGQLLLLQAVSCFAVGRMEVGDEIWHLKRLVPLLRPFDQTLPYLAGVGALWYFAVQLFVKGAAGFDSPAGMVPTFTVISLVSFAALCAVGRLATAIAVGRVGAGRATMLVALILWVVSPAIGKALQGVLDGPTALSQYLICLSPFGLILDSIDNPTLYSAFGWSGASGAAAMTYLVATPIVAAIGEYKRFRRWRRFDYHYDMPAA